MAEYRPINATTHYKCAFDVQASNFNGDAEPLMVSLRKLIRGWARNKIDGDAGQTVYEPWFFNGNPKLEPKKWLNGNQIRTGVVSTSDISTPDAWVFELIHRDHQESARRWSVDIGLRRIDSDRVRFTTAVHYWMIANYIGSYPEPPSAATPNYIRLILRDNDFVCKRGATPLRNDYEAVTHSNVQSIYDQLRDVDRDVPFVFVAKSVENDQLAINPVALYRYLLANANVYAFNDDSVLDGMNYFLGEDFRVGKGSVRCFQSHFDKARTDNKQIHRYFAPQHITEMTEHGVIEAIANGFSRNSSCLHSRDLKTFDDIFSLRRAVQIQRLKESLKEPSEETSEELQLFMEENEKLEKERQEYESFANQCIQEKDAAEKKLSDSRYQIKEAERLRQEYKGVEQGTKAIKALRKLPDTLSGILALVGQIFPQSIAVTNNAFTTASVHASRQAYWKKQENISIAWEMVFDLANLGVELFFDSDGGDLETLFNSSSRFQLAMSEGKQTKKNADLMALRKFEFEGHERDMTPHIKYGNKPEKMLRLHFAVDSENRRLIINHFGEHLENASTRNLS